MSPRFRDPRTPYPQGTKKAFGFVCLKPLGALRNLCSQLTKLQATEPCNWVFWFEVLQLKGTKESRTHNLGNCSPWEICENGFVVTRLRFSEKIGSFAVFCRGTS